MRVRESGTGLSHFRQSAEKGRVMKHPSSREFFAYWDEKRGHARAPDRSEIEPGAVRELLGDVFVLSYDAPSGHPFRVAGITATSEDGSPAHLELLLLPFHAAAHAPISLTGLLAPFESESRVLRNFELTSWRYLDPEPEELVPRALRKLKIARGFMVYEGLN